MRIKSSDSVILAVLFGVPLFLLIEHPFIFWFIFVPLLIVGITSFVKGLRK